MSPFTIYLKTRHFYPLTLPPYQDNTTQKSYLELIREKNETIKKKTQLKHNQTCDGRVLLTSTWWCGYPSPTWSCGPCQQPASHLTPIFLFN